MKVQRNDYAKQLAERDALLRECASEFSTAEASAFEVEMRRKIDAALSTSEEPSAPRHKYEVSQSVALEFSRKSTLMIQQDPGDEVVWPLK
ncbi:MULTISPECIES: hypothetical protein [unclassified Pseudomonas]|uniref:hypothetical protein n=1 Tax=unclassified Pseudomonas TaxID=196821 RepID=UPI0008760D16|nr:MULTISPECIES: hypothetical protein [unclassified Pseudomonas]SCZ74183.1 hypothetical protein SAMN03159460_04554 [Pseudomonas sp. NFPP17]SDA81448.1 hypothetical protein SAMN03159464_04735 [Pseudomonas sp. NFPP15]SEL78914.1 hypothetical protein SAMN03159324_05235 [Pseudomonas sp. NFPP18]SFA66762.1 hypothetical protein SAMN03159320_05053 [Pseudomonas sp. NFPP13]SFU07709.1 hypothetical protein SAMN03159492_05377 [Pseudomonas sp. NFPP25]